MEAAPVGTTAVVVVSYEGDELGHALALAKTNKGAHWFPAGPTDYDFDLVGRPRPAVLRRAVSVRAAFIDPQGRVTEPAAGIWPRAESTSTGNALIDKSLYSEVAGRSWEVEIHNIGIFIPAPSTQALPTIDGIPQAVPPGGAQGPRIPYRTVLVRSSDGLVKVQADSTTIHFGADLKWYGRDQESPAGLPLSPGIAIVVPEIVSVPFAGIDEPHRASRARVDAIRTDVINRLRTASQVRKFGDPVYTTLGQLFSGPDYQVEQGFANVKVYFLPNVYPDASNYLQQSADPPLARLFQFLAHAAMMTRPMMPILPRFAHGGLDFGLTIGKAYVQARTGVTPGPAEMEALTAWPALNKLMGLMTQLYYVAAAALSIELDVDRTLIVKNHLTEAPRSALRSAWEEVTEDQDVHRFLHTNADHIKLALVTFYLRQVPQYQRVYRDRRGIWLETVGQMLELPLTRLAPGPPLRLFELLHEALSPVAPTPVTSSRFGVSEPDTGSGLDRSRGPHLPAQFVVEVRDYGPERLSDEQIATVVDSLQEEADQADFLARLMMTLSNTTEGVAVTDALLVAATRPAGTAERQAAVTALRQAVTQYLRQHPDDREPLEVLLRPAVLAFGPLIMPPPAPSAPTASLAPAARDQPVRGGRGMRPARGATGVPSTGRGRGRGLGRGADGSSFDASVHPSTSPLPSHPASGLLPEEGHPGAAISGAPERIAGLWLDERTEVVVYRAPGGRGYALLSDAELARLGPRKRGPDGSAVEVLVHGEDAAVRVPVLRDGVPDEVLMDADTFAGKVLNGLLERDAAVAADATVVLLSCGSPLADSFTQQLEHALNRDEDAPGRDVLRASAGLFYNLGDPAGGPRSDGGEPWSLFVAGGVGGGWDTVNDEVGGEVHPLGAFAAVDDPGAVRRFYLGSGNTAPGPSPTGQPGEVIPAPSPGQPDPTPVVASTGGGVDRDRASSRPAFKLGPEVAIPMAGVGGVGSGLGPVAVPGTRAEVDGLPPEELSVGAAPVGRPPVGGTGMEFVSCAGWWERPVLAVTRTHPLVVSGWGLTDPSEFVGLYEGRLGGLPRVGDHIVGAYPPVGVDMAGLVTDPEVGSPDVVVAGGVHESFVGGAYSVLEVAGGVVTVVWRPAARFGGKALLGRSVDARAEVLEQIEAAMAGAGYRVEVAAQEPVNVFGLGLGLGLAREEIVRAYHEQARSEAPNLADPATRQAAAQRLAGFLADAAGFRRVTVRVEPLNVRGSFDAMNSVLRVSDRLTDVDELASTILHEMVHAWQAWMAARALAHAAGRVEVLRRWLPTLDPRVIDAAMADPLPPDAPGYAAAAEWLDVKFGSGSVRSQSVQSLRDLMASQLERAREAYRSAAARTGADALDPDSLATLRADRLTMQHEHNDVRGPYVQLADEAPAFVVERMLARVGSVVPRWSLETVPAPPEGYQLTRIPAGLYLHRVGATTSPEVGRTRIERDRMVLVVEPGVNPRVAGELLSALPPGTVVVVGPRTAVSPEQMMGLVRALARYGGPVVVGVPANRLTSRPARGDGIVPLDLRGWPSLPEVATEYRFGASSIALAWDDLLGEPIRSGVYRVSDGWVLEWRAEGIWVHRDDLSVDAVPASPRPSGSFRPRMIVGAPGQDTPDEVVAKAWAWLHLNLPPGTEPEVVIYGGTYHPAALPAPLRTMLELLTRAELASGVLDPENVEQERQRLLDQGRFAPANGWFRTHAEEHALTRAALVATYLNTATATILQDYLDRGRHQLPESPAGAAAGIVTDFLASDAAQLPVFDGTARAVLALRWEDLAGLGDGSTLSFGVPLVATAGSVAYRPGQVHLVVNSRSAVDMDSWREGTVLIRPDARFTISDRQVDEDGSVYVVLDEVPGPAWSGPTPEVPASTPAVDLDDLPPSPNPFPDTDGMDVIPSAARSETGAACDTAPRHPTPEAPHPYSGPVPEVAPASAAPTMASTQPAHLVPLAMAPPGDSMAPGDSTASGDDYPGPTVSRHRTGAVQPAPPVGPSRAAALGPFGGRPRSDDASALRLPLSEEGLHAVVSASMDADAIAGPGAGTRTLADCVTLVGQFIRMLHPDGLILAGTVDDVEAARGGVRGVQASLVAGPGWARVDSWEELARTVERVSMSEGEDGGATAVALLSFPGKRQGHVAAAHATTDGLRWIDPRKVPGGLASVSEEAPAAVGQAVIGWAVVIDRDGRVAKPGRWAAPASVDDVQALTHPPLRHDFGAMALEVERRNVRLFLPDGKDVPVKTVLLKSRDGLVRVVPDNGLVRVGENGVLYESQEAMAAAGVTGDHTVSHDGDLPISVPEMVTVPWGVSAEPHRPSRAEVLARYDDVDRRWDRAPETRRNSMEGSVTLAELFPDSEYEINPAFRDVRVVRLADLFADAPLYVQPSMGGSFGGGVLAELQELDRGIDPVSGNEPGFRAAMRFGQEVAIGYLAGKIGSRLSIEHLEALATDWDVNRIVEVMALTYVQLAAALDFGAKPEIYMKSRMAVAARQYLYHIWSEMGDLQKFFADRAEDIRELFKEYYLTLSPDYVRDYYAPDGQPVAEVDPWNGTFFYFVDEHTYVPIGTVGHLFDEILRPSPAGPRIGPEVFDVALADSGPDLDRSRGTGPGAPLPQGVLEMRNYGRWKSYRPGTFGQIDYPMMLAYIERLTEVARRGDAVAHVAHRLSLTSAGRSITTWLRRSVGAPAGPQRDRAVGGLRQAIASYLNQNPGEYPALEQALRPAVRRLGPLLPEPRADPLSAEQRDLADGATEVAWTPPPSASAAFLAAVEELADEGWGSGECVVRVGRVLDRLGVPRVSYDPDLDGSAGVLAARLGGVFHDGDWDDLAELADGAFTPVWLARPGGKQHMLLVHRTHDGPDGLVVVETEATDVQGRYLEFGAAVAGWPLVRTVVDRQGRLLQVVPGATRLVSPTGNPLPDASTLSALLDPSADTRPRGRGPQVEAAPADGGPEVDRPGPSAASPAVDLSRQVQAVLAGDAAAVLGSGWSQERWAQVVAQRATDYAEAAAAAAEGAAPSSPNGLQVSRPVEVRLAVGAAGTGSEVARAVHERLRLGRVVRLASEGEPAVSVRLPAELRYAVLRLPESPGGPMVEVLALPEATRGSAGSPVSLELWPVWHAEGVVMVPVPEPIAQALREAMPQQGWGSVVVDSGRLNTEPVGDSEPGTLFRSAVTGGWHTAEEYVEQVLPRPAPGAERPLLVLTEPLSDDESRSSFVADVRRHATVAWHQAPRVGDGGTGGDTVWQATRAGRNAHVFSYPRLGPLLATFAGPEQVPAPFADDSAKASRANPLRRLPGGVWLVAPPVGYSVPASVVVTADQTVSVTGLGGAGQRYPDDVVVVAGVAGEGQTPGLAVRDAESSQVLPVSRLVDHVLHLPGVTTDHVLVLMLHGSYRDVRALASAVQEEIDRRHLAGEPSVAGVVVAAQVQFGSRMYGLTVTSGQPVLEWVGLTPGGAGRSTTNLSEAVTHARVHGLPATDLEQAVRAALQQQGAGGLGAGMAAAVADRVVRHGQTQEAAVRPGEAPPTGVPAYEPVAGPRPPVEVIIDVPVATGTARTASEQVAAVQQRLALGTVCALPRRGEPTVSVRLPIGVPHGVLSLPASPAGPAVQVLALPNKDIQVDDAHSTLVSVPANLWVNWYAGGPAAVFVVRDTEEPELRAAIPDPARGRVFVEPGEFNTGTETDGTADSHGPGTMLWSQVTGEWMTAAEYVDRWLPRRPAGAALPVVVFTEPMRGRRMDLTPFVQQLAQHAIVVWRDNRPDSSNPDLDAAWRSWGHLDGTATAPREDSNQQLEELLRPHIQRPSEGTDRALQQLSQPQPNPSAELVEAVRSAFDQHRPADSAGDDDVRWVPIALDSSTDPSATAERWLGESSIAGDLPGRWPSAVPDAPPPDVPPLGGASLVDLLRSSPAPLFLAGLDVGGLEPAQLVELLRRLDLSRPTPEPVLADLPADPDTVWSEDRPVDDVVAQLLDMDGAWVEELVAQDWRVARIEEWRAGQLAARGRVELPKLLHTSVLGGALGGPEGELVRARIADLARAAARGGITTVLWTELSRAEVAAGVGRPGDLAGWAGRHGVVLASVGEVWHAGAPMRLAEQFQVEVARQSGAGLAAANAILAAEALDRFGGIYTAPTNRLVEVTGFELLLGTAGYAISQPANRVRNVSAMVAVRGHPFTRLLIDALADEHARGGTGSGVDRLQRVARGLGYDDDAGLTPLGQFEPRADAAARRSPLAAVRSYTEAEVHRVVDLAAAVLGYELGVGEGELFLPAVAAAVAGLPDPAAGWEAVVERLLNEPNLPAISRVMTGMTYLSGGVEEHDEVSLPPVVRERLTAALTEPPGAVPPAAEQASLAAAEEAPGPDRVTGTCGG